MESTRLEAFSDAVMAIVITIMVLELKAPEDTELNALIPLIPVFLSYMLSFFYIGIIWNNHHHLFHLVHHVNGKTLWANLLFLFCVSMIPFSTSWLGEHHAAKMPAAIYGFNLLLVALSGNIVKNTIVKHKSININAKEILNSNTQFKTTLMLYLLGIVLSFFYSIIAVILYLFAAILWAVPNKKIETFIKN